MKIKHWLLPGKHNKFHPHILRPIGLFLVLAVLVLIPPVYNIASAGKFQVLGYATNVTINELHSYTNQKRAQDDLSQFSLSSKLNNAALAKAKHMIANDYWAHVAPDGTTPWSFILSSGYSYSSAGENLAKGFYTSTGIVDAWMNSPSHRDNIVNERFEDVGYAILNGVLQGEKVTLVVAMYASEYVAPVATTNTAATTPNSVTQNEKAVKKSTETQANSTDPTANQESNISQQSGSGDILGALSAPIEAYGSLNWGQKASILIMCTVALLFILKHTLIWRAKRQGVRGIWLRSHPIGQASVLIAAIIITTFSGVGVVI